MDKIKRKTMLYKTGVEYGDYTVNHIVGCTHGCNYPCYAYMMAHRFGKAKTIYEWCEPYICDNAIEILEKELPKMCHKIKSVQLCFSTDPFMYKRDDIADISIKVINTINKYDIPCNILTKGVLPKQLSELSKINNYGITLVSVDEEFRKKYEPNAAPFKDRISSLRRLHDLGYKTWVSIEPYPTPNIIEQNLREILETIKFVDYIVFGRLHYNKLVTQYNDYQNFYNDCAQIVIDFCNENEIKYHIKKGTKKND